MYAFALKHLIPYLSIEQVPDYLAGCSETSHFYNVLYLLTFWPLWPFALVAGLAATNLALSDGGGKGLVG